MDEAQVVFVRGRGGDLFHAAVQGHQIVLQRRRDGAQPTLMLRVPPAGVVQHRRGVHEEAGHVRAIRSWMLRISGRRVRCAVTASTAALVADMVVRYGTP